MVSLSSPPPTYGGEMEEQGVDDEEEEEEMTTDECDDVSVLEDVKEKAWGAYQEVQGVATGQGQELVTEQPFAPIPISEQFHAAQEEYRKYIANGETSIFVEISDFFVPHEANIMMGGNGSEEEIDEIENAVNMPKSNSARGRGLARGQGLGPVSARGQGLDEQRLRHLHAARALEMRALEALER